MPEHVFDLWHYEYEQTRPDKSGDLHRLLLDSVPATQLADAGKLERQAQICIFGRLAESAHGSRHRPTSKNVRRCKLEVHKVLSTRNRKTQHIPVNVNMEGRRNLKSYQASCLAPGVAYTTPN